MILKNGIKKHDLRYMLKRYKLVLLSIPWILLLIVLLLWSLGIKLPSFNKEVVELQNTTLILERIEELGKLELVKFNFKEIYDYQAISEGKINSSTAFRTYDFNPDLKIALIASGEAVGCIDLRNMDLNNIEIEKDTLFFKIPPPELCYHKLDLENSRVYDFERSGFWSNIFPDDDEVTRAVDNAYREAEDQIRISALESGILEQTALNGEKVLRPILEKISGKVVVFTQSPENVRLQQEYE
jgi:hypothetical protein